MRILLYFIKITKVVCLLAPIVMLSSCSQKENTYSNDVPLPIKIIDLGALVTEDLSERVWGKRYLTDLGWTGANKFDIIKWKFGSVNGSNANYTIFNHGGPHVDGPNHIGLQGGLDSYRVESFTGHLKVFDVSNLSFGRTVTKEFFEDQDIDAGDIVMIYTNYQAPKTENDYPETITLTRKAAEYLGEIPIKAFATDAWSVATSPGDRPAKSPSNLIELAPVHHSFLSRGMPIFEQLFNVEKLLNKKKMYFVGPPLNIKNGDGMIVRPVVLVYN